MSLSVEATKYIQSNGQLDLHCWCVSKTDGTVIDPDFEYDYVKRVRNIKKTSKTLYREFDTSLQIELVPYIIKNFVKNRIPGYSKYLNTNDMGVFEYFSHNPTKGNCPINAYSYWVINKDECLFKIGSMGWTTKDGNVWWEFG